jgi:hypothetical protein
MASILTIGLILGIAFLWLRGTPLGWFAAFIPLEWLFLVIAWDQSDLWRIVGSIFVLCLAGIPCFLTHPELFATHDVRRDEPVYREVLDRNGERIGSLSAYVAERRRRRIEGTRV